jgi:small-conductance mechanosensitive channel
MPEGEQQSAAATTAERVRTILEAAERSAAELEAASREQAERIRAAAERDAERAREVLGALTDRADELKRRLDELADAVLGSVEALKAELDGLRAVPREGAPAAPASGSGVDEQVIAEAEAAAARKPDVAEAEGPPPPAAEEPAEAEAPTTPAGSATPEGARVLALKMALDGSPREETARYLRENFELDDPDGLLDEVYARAGR